MAIMNMQDPAMAEPSMEEPMMAPSEEPAMSGGMMIPDDGGVDEEEYVQDIQANLEEHLNNLPDPAKEFLSEWVTTPEFVTAIELINGPEVGDYFRRYMDPTKKAVVQTVSPQQEAPAAQAPSMEQPSMAPAEQSAPAAAPQGGGIMNV